MQIDMTFLTQTMPEVSEALLEKFASYHSKNPHVYREFERLANQAYDAGRRQYSGWIIVNVMRWNHDISTTGKPFKISNDYIAIYTRLYTIVNPDKQGFFKLKEMKKVRTILDGE